MVNHVGLFEVLERVGKVTYKLLMPPRLFGVHNVFHVIMLKDYHQGSMPHMINFNDIEVNDNVSYTERPIRILNRGVKKLRKKKISMVKV